jgi:uncharacterized protein YgiM (DUF1202 family)
MPARLALRRIARAAAAAAVVAALAACGDLAASLPARPTPVPTLARLPSVTPVTPRPTAPLTPTTPAATPTAAAPTGTVARNANVRAGPGVDFAIVAVQDAGAQVALQARSGQWYQIRTVDGVEGWMAAQVLEVDPATASALPEASP